MMGKSWIAFGLAVVLLLLPMMPAAARQNRLAVGFGGVKQIPHMATLVAMERLRDRGYDTVPVFLPQSHLIIQAVLLKELDFGSTLPSPSPLRSSKGRRSPSSARTRCRG